MMTSFTTATVYEIHKVNPSCVDDGEGSSAVLGICTQIFGVVTELEGVANLPERRLLEVGPVPFLHSLAHQSHTKSFI